MPPCLTLSIIRYGSRVKRSNPGKGVVSYRKGSLRVTLDYGRLLYLLLIHYKNIVTFSKQIVIMYIVIVKYEFHRCKDLLITTHSLKNRRTFLTSYIQEKTIPTSMSSGLRPSPHIFSDYIRPYLESSIRDLKFSEAHTFEKARLIGLELRRK